MVDCPEALMLPIEMGVIAELFAYYFRDHLRSFGVKQVGCERHGLW